MINDNSLFKKRLEQLGIKKQVDASMIVENAQKKLFEIFGNRAEQNLQVVSFRKGTLKIAAKNSAWANECQGHLLELKKKPVEKIIFTSFFEEN